MSDFSFSQLQEVAKESGFVVLDAGTYHMRITKADAVKTKDNTKDMFKVTFSVVAGPMAGKGSVINNFTVSPDSPKALWFFFKHMKVLGLGEEYFQANPKPEKVASDLLNREAMVELSVGSWQGNEKNDVVSIKPVPGTPSAAPPIGGGGGSGIPTITVPSPNANNGQQSGVPTVKTPVATTTTATVTPPPPPVVNGDAAAGQQTSVVAVEDRPAESTGGQPDMPPAPF